MASSLFSLPLGRVRAALGVLCGVAWLPSSSPPLPSPPLPRFRVARGGPSLVAASCGVFGEVVVGVFCFALSSLRLGACRLVRLVWRGLAQLLRVPSAFSRSLSLRGPPSSPLAALALLLGVGARPLGRGLAWRAFGYGRPLPAQRGSAPLRWPRRPGGPAPPLAPPCLFWRLRGRRPPSSLCAQVS